MKGLVDRNKILLTALVMLLLAGGLFAQSEDDFNVILTDDFKAAKIVKYVGTVKDVKIPGTIQGMPVREIGAGAFADTDINSVEIPEGIVLIETRAFAGSKLVSVSWPGSITEIQFDAFLGCEKLTDVTIPEGITAIGYGAFTGCLSLTSITLPSTIRRIEGNAFKGCKSLKNVNIPESVKKIRFEDNSAFNGCPKITLVSQAGLKQRGYTGRF